MVMKNEKDPQTIVVGRVKPCKNSQEREIGVFSINIGFYELVCLVNLPIDQEDTFKVYVKHKIKNPFVSDNDRSPDNETLV